LNIPGVSLIMAHDRMVKIKIFKIMAIGKKLLKLNKEITPQISLEA